MSRKVKLLSNTVAAIIFQITTIVCGFILPKLILKQYGSAVNGLTQSISQFMSLITFLELGIGAVVQSSLYKPLAENNKEKISCIVVSANKFFRKIAIILLIYIVVLICVYPFLVNDSFDWVFSALLIAAMSISYFAQYYFGVVDRLLLTADQRGYIQYSAQTITLILNTVVCSILINNQVSIQLVKLTTSLIYLLRPIFLRIYVNKKYTIDRKIKYAEEPIKQKWNGVAQHVAAIVLDGTDIVVLTLFSTLENVSIYSVYFLVISGLKNLFSVAVSGVQSLMGEVIARGEEQNLKNLFLKFEWIIHIATLFVFGCTLMLINPFVQVYTKGIIDVNYIQPVFSIIIVIAYMLHTIRIPYLIAVLAIGHYKQTQNSFIIAAAINIVISIIAVFLWGLIGVAIGTLVAMVYQTAWLAIYSIKKIIKIPYRYIIKQLIVDAIMGVAIYFSTFWITLGEVSYGSWIVMALKVAGIIFADIAVINLLCYYKNIMTFAKKIIHKIKRKKNATQQ